ncbi:MAG: hypothetical protein PHR36_04610 [Patescibacteria group bacterium]|nr:hypothetical protein [Patescibacteria group bacterium]
MPSKSLDGIKKLSGEELVRARKIVLDTIGETDKQEKGKTLRSFIMPKRDQDRQAVRPELGTGAQGGEKKIFSSGRKMLDGVSSIPPRSAGKKITITKDEMLKGKASLAKDLDAESRKKEKNEEKKEESVISSPPRPATFKKSLTSGIAQIGKAAKETELKKQESKKTITAKAGQGKQKSEAEEEMRRNEEMKKKEMEEQKKKEAIKKKAEEKEAKAKMKAEKEREKTRVKEQKEKIRQERKRQRKQAREIWLLEAKKKLSGLFRGLGRSSWLAGKIIVFSTLFLVVSAVLLYLIFSFLLLKLNLDNKISRQAASYLPVPAVITKIGFIEYYDYQNIMGELKKELDSGQEFERVARRVFIEEISLARLAKKYNLSFIGKGQEEIVKEINLQLALDKEENEVSYSRINKIKELVSAPQVEESFEKIGGKYGDEQGYVSEDSEFLQLTEEVKRLEIGQVSDIIITDRGYYLVKKEDTRLKYIFIKSITLDEYLDKMLEELKVLVLAD